MTPRFRSRYRIPSARLVRHDYAFACLYAVTWCTAQRAPVLGCVEGERMRLSALGCVVHDQIAALSERTAAATVDVFVVMPDHVHVLFRLHGSLSLGAAVRHVKAGSVRDARRAGLWGDAPLWQTRFWDTVVRSDAHHAALRRYIADNPPRWSARRGR